MESDLVQREGIDSAEILQRKILDCLSARQESIKIIDLLNKLKEDGDNGPLSIMEVQNAVRKLEEDKKITSVDLATKDSFRRYLTKGDAAPFFWLCTISTAVSLAAVYLIPDLVGSWSGIFRGSICGLYLTLMPGSAFVKLILPSTGNNDLIEQTILGIAFSLALVSIIGVIIYYGYGLRLDIITLTIGAVTIIMSITAKYTEFRNRVTTVASGYQGID